jgi:hypothetical protein
LSTASIIEETNPARNKTSPMIRNSGIGSMAKFVTESRMLRINISRPYEVYRYDIHQPEGKEDRQSSSH